MYYTLLVAHNIMRWAVFISLVVAIVKAYSGYKAKKQYTKADNFLRHSTATLAHIQLVLGMVLYFRSPLVKAILTTQQSVGVEGAFFAFIHEGIMLTAVVLITVGSSLAKRKTDDMQKFKTQWVWFGIALLLILVAIPWPFSPLAQRPLLRF